MKNTTSTNQEMCEAIRSAMDLWNQIMDIAKKNTDSDEAAFQMAAAEMNRRMGL